MYIIDSFIAHFDVIYSEIVQEDRNVWGHLQNWELNRDMVIVTLYLSLHNVLKSNTVDSQFKWSFKRAKNPWETETEFL